MLVLHQRLYNACLEQRIWSYSWQRRVELKRELTEQERDQLPNSFYSQRRQLKDIRKAFPEYEALSQKSLELTFQRLDRAFQNFFRRIKEGKAGKEVGFPRFKSLERYPGFGFRAHGNGWKFIPGEDFHHGKLRIKGIDGTIRCRGKARTPGEIKTCELIHRDGVWHLSLTLDCKPERTCGKKSAGLDWGVSKYATLYPNKGKPEVIDNALLLKRAESKLKKHQRDLSRKVRGSNNRKKQRVVLAKAHWRLANRRRDLEHQTTKKLVDKYGLISTEKLSVKNMTGSAKGSAEKPGKMVKQKAGLNRAILDTAPGAFMQKLKYKLEEAEGVWVEVPTRKVKPSQTCPVCGAVEKKTLSQRRHKCGSCGHTADRDVAAAHVMLNWALEDMKKAA